MSPQIFALIMKPLAERIRSNPSIQGITSQGQQHKISLFADDVILSLSNPTVSLPSAHNVLQIFGKASYYNVNTTKSNILNIAVPRNVEKQLKGALPYPWTNKSIMYLGIELTSPVSNLFQLNYVPLIDNFQKELLKLQRFYLSWSGHLAAYKMLLLPKLLYIFRALPIRIPCSFFTTMQNQLSRFVWGGG